LIRKRTFIDAGVLIAAARGRDAPSMSALEILDDQSREFVSSPFVELEVLPKAIFLSGAEELVTTERASKPIHRVQGILITSIHVDS